jgi:hypothetical protein
LPAADPLSAPAAKPGDSGPVRRARLAFRQWRRTRPFWGGLLIVAGGGEILSTTVLSIGPTLRVGLGGVNGFVGTMIAFVLALCGLLLWFSPAQRVFYSIVAIVLALASFNTINYGGFFIGMLLGIIGGGLAFAWSHAGERTKARERSGASGLVVLLMLAPSLQAAHPAGAHHAMRAQLTAAASAPQGCILGILCLPSPKPTPSGGPSPSPSSPAPSPSSGSPTPGGTKSSGPGGSKKTGGSSEKKKKGKIKRTPAPRGLVAASVPTQLTASSAELVGLAYDGVAEVPRSSGGPVAMMKFTLRSVTLTGKPTLTIQQNHSIGTTSTTLLSFTGNVVLYATKLSGDLLGVPVTLTPSSPLSLVLKLLSPLTKGLTVTMTHVVTDQPLTMAAASQWSNFLISVRPA